MTTGFGDPQTICTQIERTWASQTDTVKWRMIAELRELEQRRDLDRLLAIDIAYLEDEIQHTIGRLDQRKSHL